MSYTGSTGSLMAGARMLELLEKLFGSVSKMLTYKKYPQCVRALRLLVKDSSHSE